MHTDPRFWPYYPWAGPSCYRLLRSNPVLLGRHRGEHRALTARRDQASLARLTRIVRHLSANLRIRIRPDILSTNAVHVAGGTERTLRLQLILIGLRRLSVGPVDTIFRPRQSRTGNHSNQRHSREQFDHCVVSLASLWVVPLWVIAHVRTTTHFITKLNAFHNFSMPNTIEIMTVFTRFLLFEILCQASHCILVRL